MRIRTGDVTAPAEQSLLTDYFTFREASFPSAGGYRRTMPAAEQFDGVHGVFLVVEDDDGRPVGCGGLRMLASDASAPRGEIKHVWLGEGARGRGWATALMSELEQRARDFGAAEVVLDTHHSLESAGRLYARLGYEPTAPYNDNPNATRWYKKVLD
ncbi:GNAT family N-acetyltransferase [Herbiconiux sp. 11R-BC]|uniref:GNAT family N-acetyltransferase n=1 Tax=Herbiconiux sp. 11R-BC TaxID=3111637 RepID=UPI003C0341FA